MLNACYVIACMLQAASGPPHLTSVVSGELAKLTVRREMSQRKGKRKVTCHRVRTAATCMSLGFCDCNARTRLSSSVQINFAGGPPARATQAARQRAQSEDGQASPATVRPCRSDRASKPAIVVSGLGCAMFEGWCRMARIQRQSCDLALDTNRLSGLALVLLRLGRVEDGDWHGGDGVGENSAEGFHGVRSRLMGYTHVKTACASGMICFAGTVKSEL